MSETTSTAGGAPITTPPAQAPNRGPSPAMTEALARNWWALALRGVLAILFGFFTVFTPGAVLLSLALFFAAYLLVDGVLGIISAIRAARANERWGWLLAEGVLNILMGLLAALFPIGAVFGFVLVTAVWAIVTGGMMIGSAVRLEANRGRWWLGLGGVVSILFGIALILAPMVGAVVLTWWLGIYAFAFGFVMIALAFRLRNRGAGTTTPPAAQPA
jgi:uncharacterized membrane protein HdeD (DUF308 family)